MSGMGSHTRPVEGETVEWYTPPGIFEALSIDFALDPAHPADKLPWIPAARTFCKADDGLSQPWEGRVWLNPPYGRETDPWLERFVEHGNGIALVFARTETEWFHRHALAVDAWCLIRGRLTFVDGDGTPGRFNGGAPSVLLASGPECVEALMRSDLGITIGVDASAQQAQTSIWTGRSTQLSVSPDPEEDCETCKGEGGWDSPDAIDRARNAEAGGHSGAAAGWVVCPDCNGTGKKPPRDTGEEPGREGDQRALVRGAVRNWSDQPECDKLASHEEEEVTDAVVTALEAGS